MSRHPIHAPGDPADDALSALYEAHLGAGAGAASGPSATADARVRALARESIATAAASAPSPAARPAPAKRSGWQLWINAAWFKPGLAFASLASLSVVIVALMPREDLNVERAETTASMSAQSASAPKTAPERAPASPAVADSAGAAPAAATDSAAARMAGTSTPSAPAQPAPEPPAAMTQSPVAVSKQIARDSPAARPQPAPTLRARQDSAEKVAAQAPQTRAKERLGGQSAAMSEPASSRPAASAPAQRDAMLGRQPSAPASVPAAAPPAAQAPNPFPAADASAPAARLEKPSLQSQPAEYRANTQPLPEVRDSAPTYPREAQAPGRQSSAQAQRPPQPASGYASEMARSQSTLSAARKEEALQKRAYEGTTPMSAAPRNPAEWIRAILKLKSDGRNEQVLKELIEFRKYYPAYSLPEELKPLAAAK